MEYRHTSVMLKEIMEYLNPQEGGYFIDCTLGGAGYTLAIARKIGDKGRVLAIDLDQMALANARQKIELENSASGGKYTNIILAHDNFKNLSNIVKTSFPDDADVRFDGIVLDLGLSGAQLEDRDRGFSFREDAALDMSFDKGGETAEYSTRYIVNNFKASELEKIIKDYGEERFAKYIVNKIIKYREEQPIVTTGQLVGIIESAVPKKFQHGHTHPATRTFQALRIATNEELRNIEEVLPQAISLLKAGGRLVVVSFHSLEDRIVKHFFRTESKDCLCPSTQWQCDCGHKASLKVLTKKIIEPTEEEIKNNPKSRSAKMRVAEKI